MDARVPRLRLPRSGLALAAGVIGLAACTADPVDPSPSPVPSSTEATPAQTAEPSASGSGPVETSVLDLGVGDCFSIDVDELATVPVVACDSPHQYEVFALVEHPAGSNDPFPGDPALLEHADVACQAAFAGYVGVDYVSSAWFIAGLTPSEQTWADGDREIVCALHQSDGFGDPITVTGSAEGSAE